MVFNLQSTHIVTGAYAKTKMKWKHLQMTFRPHPRPNRVGEITKDYSMCCAMLCSVCTTIGPTTGLNLVGIRGRLSKHWQGHTERVNGFVHLPRLVELLTTLHHPTTHTQINSQNGKKGSEGYLVS